MSIKYHPNQGTLLVCNFDGLVVPEMIKTRPVVIVSPRQRQNSGLCVVVPLSTTVPAPKMPWHCKLTFDEPLSPKWEEKEIWVKCDMIYTMRFERLDRFHKRVGIHRKYYDRQLSEAQIKEVTDCLSLFLRF